MKTAETETSDGSEGKLNQPPLRGRPWSWWHPSSLVPTYLGILLTIVGFALIGLAWAQVAGETNVAKQLPYVISAGFSGLGLIMSGLLVINIAAKRQDASERHRQLAQLTEALRDLKRSIDGS